MTVETEDSGMTEEQRRAAAREKFLQRSAEDTEACLPSRQEDFRGTGKLCYVDFVASALDNFPEGYLALERLMQSATRDARSAFEVLLHDLYLRWWCFRKGLPSHGRIPDGAALPYWRDAQETPATRVGE